MLKELLNACGCECCKTTNIKLEGAALEAVRTFDAKTDDLLAQAKVAREEMWAAIKRETGTESVDTDRLDLDTKYLAEFGLAVLKVPASHFPIETALVEPAPEPEVAAAA